MGRRKGINDEQRQRWALSVVRREDSMISPEAGKCVRSIYRFKMGTRQRTTE